MDKKPTYEELEKRIKELETVVDNRNQIDRDVLRLKAAIEQVPVGIALADENMSIYYCNPAGLGLRGGDKASLVEIPKDAFDNWQVLKLNGEPYEIDDLPLVKAVTTGKAVKEDFIVKHQDGADHICAATAAPVYKNNIIIGGMVIFPDVTERIEIEKTLKESETKHKEMIANISDVIAIIDSNGIIKYKSPNIEKWFGWHPEDLVGTDCWETVHPDDLDYVQTEFLTLLKKDNSTTTVEYRYKCKDESYKWIELTAMNLVNDSTVNGVLMNYHDITERNRAEEALRESEAKFRSFAEQSIVGIYLISGSVFTYVNPKFAEIFGYSVDECLDNMYFRQLVHPEDLATVEQQVGRRLSGETKAVRYSFRGIKKSGETNHVEIFGSSMLLKGKSVVTGTMLDITDRKQAEEKREQLQTQLQQAQKMEAIGTLAGGIAHDFNNLLMAIQGRTSIMLTKKDSSHPDIRHLKGIEDNVESAADLTRQLLGFARGGKYEVKPTDLNELIKKQNRMFGRTKKQISIRGKYEKDLWSVEVDQGQIDQVLLNLYVNAWQAMPAGGDLYLETENVTLDENYVKPFSIETGKYVKISVTDTGTGMDKATQEKIFEPFFTTKEMGRGTGLGLASTYGIIKNHGGFINVYSEKGHGTTFNIYLPASEKEIIEEKKPAGETLRGSETILFVDDEDMIIEVAEEMFEQLGYKLLIARSGKEAIKTYQENKERIDIVLLDMIMPDMSGSDTYGSLKEIDPDIKVLLSSGYSINGRATEILDRGCNGFIQKPFKMQELSQKLREILDDK